METSIRGISTLFLTCILLCSLFDPTTAGASEGNIGTTYKYAWSENSGWLNFRPTNGGVTVNGTYLSGYAWAENIGWIKLGSGTGPYNNTTNSNWGVNRDSNTGALSGYAWSENAGWINFSPSDSQVTINTTTGSFDGYAWAENVGWIHFKYDDPEYYVQVAVSTGTYYVDIQNGNDSNAGTAASPWKTLHYAIDQINGGATGTSALPYALIMAAGTYSTGNGEADTGNTLSQSHVTIVGANDHTIGSDSTTTLIDGENATNWTKGLEITGSNVTVENLYVTGFSDEAEEGIRISEDADNNKVRKCKIYDNNWGIRVDHSDGNQIRGCEIYQNTTHGIDVTWSTNTVIVGNKVYSNPQYGIRVQCSPEISRNLIYDNDTSIHVEASKENDISSPTIKNNVIYKTASGAMSYGIYTKAVPDSTYTTTASPAIYHNTIDGGTFTGIAMERSGDGVSAPTIKYNIITSFGQYGIKNTDAGPTIEYNDLYNNTLGSYSGGTISNTNISQNPRYGSYTLQSDSPCINKIPSSENDPVTLDYPGFTRPRPGKTTKDMGAYEYIADVTNNYTLPGGTGVATDYRIFTVPLNLGTGADMLTAMEIVLGTYAPSRWRGFLYSGTSYRELNSSQFASATIKPGMGFWIITTYTSQIPFQGGTCPGRGRLCDDVGPGLAPHRSAMDRHPGFSGQYDSYRWRKFLCRHQYRQQPDPEICVGIIPERKRTIIAVTYNRQVSFQSTQGIFSRLRPHHP